ncbi:MAG TPA: M36 family metallopeptidase [Blastocatellia bacterium]|nr:M36 family metallopeptidase [Blastocatellia bacterium]
MKGTSHVVAALAIILTVLLALSVAGQHFNSLRSFVQPDLSFSPGSSFNAPPGAVSTQRRRPRTLENFDIRADQNRSLAVPADNPRGRNSAQMAAREPQLLRTRPRAQVRRNSLTGAPTRIFSADEPLRAPDEAEPEMIARRFLSENSDLYHLSAEEISSLRVTARHTTTHNGLTHLTLQQTSGGIEIFGARLTAHLDRHGAVIAATGELLPAAARTTRPDSPRLSAAEALKFAATYADVTPDGQFNLTAAATDAEQRQRFSQSESFAREVNARLVYFPLAADQMRLAWEFELWLKETPDAYLIVVDAARGSLLWRYNLTCYDENPLRPHGLVFTGDSPRPDNPHTNENPPTVQRQDRPFHAEPFNGAQVAPADPHYDWWAGAPADSLVSNNADAHTDRDSNNQPDLPLLKAPDGNFSFPLDLAQSPATEPNQQAALVNLFYHVNRFHDILYLLGFTESAGNFQTANFGLGGAEGDAIQADAQDGSGTNNANFSTPPDGRPGRVQMFLWTGSPQLDGDLDQTVILHELTHGVSNRLIGNGTGLSGFQARGMGEGWSDYFALALMRNESDPADGAYAIGQYVRNNYAQGIRRYPYSTNKAISPLTFAALSLSPSVHAAGEIWCVTLWEMRALLIQKYGFEAGQRQSLQLVIDGMKLTPPDPTFLEARDAILLADRVNNNGANQCLLWQAFAKRGMGYSASTLSVADNAPQEAFDLPPYCSESGSLRLDKGGYVVGEAIRVMLGDFNATAPVRVRVSSSVTGDEETITLAPDQAFQGSFSGSLRLAAGRAGSGDGLLQASVEAGDQIVVTYDDAGNANGNSATVTARAGVVREKTVFEDNVENGNQGWIASGAWAITRARSASASHSWTDSPAGSYSNNSDTALTSPLIDLTGLGEVTLCFAQSYDLEYRYDFGLVEYSIDDGATWTKAAAFTGSQTDFVQSKVRLEALAGKNRARFRFRLLSDQAETGDGWYIDNIRLTARSADAAVIRPGAAPAPVISSVSPAFSSPAGGAKVTITGLNFTDNADTTVTFDSLPGLNVNVTGSTTLTVTAPAHAAGAVTVRLSNRNGSAALASGFTYFQPGSATNAPAPRVDRIFPSSGSVRGGTVVSVIGENFTPETTAAFGSQAATVIFVNANTLRAITPPAAAAGLASVTFSNGAHQTTLGDGFTYVQPSPPTVQLLSPNDDTMFIGSTLNIRWKSADNGAVVKHRIALVRNSGGQMVTITEIADDLPGDAQSFNWTIPDAISPTTQARIRLIATDDEGAETEAYSASDFTIARRWEAAAPLPFPLQRLQAASDGRYLYVIGGRTSSSISTTIETVSRFDPVTNAWTNLGIAPMPMGLSSGEAVYLNGRIYVPGGFTSSSTTPAQQHYVYDIAGNSWSLASAVPAAAYFYALAADEARGSYYLTGGSNNLSGPLAIVRAYNPQTEAWSELPPMSTARYGHEAAMIEGRLYVAGGFGLTGGLVSAEVFDFSAQKWSPVASLSRPRRFAASAVGRDAAGNPLWLIAGGEDPLTGLPVSGAEAYDVRRNRWVALDNSFNQPTPRTQSAGAVINGAFYTIGGAAVQGSFVTLNTVPAVERMRVDGFNAISTTAPPVLAVPATQTATAGRELRFSVSASDLNSAVPLTITAQGLPDRASFTTTSITSNSTRGEFRWTPSSEDTGKTLMLTFTASDDSLCDVRSVMINVVATAPLAVVSAASYRGDVISPDSIVAAFGTNLAVRTETAQTLPLPLELAGTSVTVNGVAAPLFFVSPNQINFAVPGSPDIGESGEATVIVHTPTGSYALGTVALAPSHPALFSADSSGQGEAAALATPDGITYQSPPFDVTLDGRPNILVLYGTGFRHAAEAVTVRIGDRQARVLYAGAQGSFVGLDQLNVEIPQSLASINSAPRRVELTVTFNGFETSRMYVTLR